MTHCSDPLSSKRKEKATARDFTFVLFFTVFKPLY